MDEASLREAARDLLAISRTKALGKLIELRSAQRGEQGETTRYRIEVEPLGLVLQDTELIPLARALARAVGVSK